MQQHAENHHDPTAKDHAAVERISKRFAAHREKWQAWLHKHPRFRWIYRVLLLLVGGLVILAGIAMLILPGPGWLTIFLGLAILGSEFAWARKTLVWLRMQVRAAIYRWRSFRAARKAKKHGKV